MGLRDLFSRDRMNPEATDLADAQRMEANRQHLIRIDPDAARILTTNIVNAHHSWAVNARFSEENRAYAAAKHTEGRMDLYNRLFADIN